MSGPHQALTPFQICQQRKSLSLTETRKLWGGSLHSNLDPEPRVRAPAGCHGGGRGAGSRVSYPGVCAPLRSPGRCAFGTAMFITRPPS